jgi:hypothetical protein
MLISSVTCLKKNFMKELHVRLLNKMREKLTGGRGARKARNLTGLSAQS